MRTDEERRLGSSYPDDFRSNLGTHPVTGRAMECFGAWWRTFPRTDGRKSSGSMMRTEQPPMSSIKRDVKKKVLPRPEGEKILSRDPAHFTVRVGASLARWREMARTLGGWHLGRNYFQGGPIPKKTNSLRIPLPRVPSPETIWRYVSGRCRAQPPAGENAA